MLPSRLGFSAIPAKLMILCLLALLSTATAIAATLPRLALIPLANYSESMQGAKAIEASLRDRLTAAGFDLVAADTLRGLMRSHRLRLIGECDSSSAALIAAATGAEVILTGAIELYLEQENPEVAVNLRAYDCRDGGIVWLNRCALSGEGEAGAFGIGRISFVETLTSKVLDRLLKDAAKLIAQRSDAIEEPAKKDRALAARGRVAVVEIDNACDFAGAGAAATGALIYELHRRGYRLLEPGELTRLQQKLGINVQGGAVAPLPDVLAAELGVGTIVTGIVTEFLPSRGGDSEIGPHVELTLRMIDARTGELTAATSVVRDGADTETLFGIGRTYAIGELTLAAVHHACNKLIEEEHRDLGPSRTGTTSIEKGN